MGASLVADELARFHDLTETTLAWTRPNFFELRYELSAPSGVLLRLSVEGIRPERHIRIDTADRSWKIDAFPLQKRESPVFEADLPDPIAFYLGGPEPGVRLAGGETYRFRSEPPQKTVCETSEGELVFALERVEFFPRWRLEMELTPRARSLPEFPILIACTCCSLVFG